MKVILVEDSEAMQELITSTLNDLDVLDVTAMDDGQQAQTYLSNVGDKSSSFDLIISDYEMPNMNGISLLKWIRNESFVKNIPFILLTSRDDFSVVAEAMQEGVSEFLAKPFTSSDLEKK